MPALMEPEKIVSIPSPTDVGGACGLIDTNDEELIRRISRLIRRKTNLGVQEMKVTFENGCVILSGYCRTFYTKQLAQEAVLAVIGEVELVNQIRVA